jgi:hypothetical protein
MTDAANVDVAYTGAIQYAPTGSTAPVDADTPMLTPWGGVGLISSDGVEITPERSVSNIVAWQRAQIARTVVTESSIQVAFSMIETNERSLELYWGASLNTADGSIEIDPGQTGGRRAFALDYVDGEKFVRLYLPLGEVTELEAITWNSSGDPVGYGVTITGYRDDAAGYTAKYFNSSLVVVP